MHLKTLNKLICVVIPLIICTACSQNTVEHTVNYLTSKTVNGRMYDYKGNKLTQLYLEKQLKQANVLPLSEKYAVPFSASLPFDIEYSVSISAKSGNIALTPVEHFTPIIGYAFNVSGVLCETDNKLVAKNADGIQTIEIIQYDGKSNANFYQTPVKTLYVTPSGMELLYKNLGAELNYSCEPKLLNKSLNNIFAVQKGENSSTAIVLGAHFDDTCAADGTTQGAIDNASGVACVLQVARLLANQTLPCDIVYAFWNAEEAGLAGSKEGRKELDAKYENYLYINIDCIGYIAGGKIEVSTSSGANELSDFVANKLLQEGYENIISANVFASSDHNSFSDISNVVFAQSYNNMPFHTPRDNIEAINTEDITAFSIALANSLQKNADELINFSTTEPVSTETEQEHYKQIDAYKKTLAVDEMIYIKGQQYLSLVESDAATYFTSQDELHKLYPNIRIAPTIDDYKLSIIEISHAIAAEDLPEKPIEGKIYKRGFSAIDAYSIEATYADLNGDAISCKWLISADIITSKKPVDGMKNAFTLDSNGYPELLVATEQHALMIRLGTVVEAHGRNVFCLTNGITNDALINVSKTILKTPPIIVD